jgi:hypothetical protein
MLAMCADLGADLHVMCPLRCLILTKLECEDKVHEHLFNDPQVITC